MNAPTQIPVAELRPIATLTQDDGFVMIITDSGYSTTPHGVHIGRRIKGDYIHDFMGNGIHGEYGQEPLLWTPIPFSPEDVKTAYALSQSISEPIQPILEGDPSDHLQLVRAVIKEVTDEDLDPRRALLRIHRALGDDLDGPRLPHDAPNDLVQVRFQITRWVQFSMYDDEAIDEVLACLKKED